MKRLRFVMSGGQVTTSAIVRRYSRGDRVFVNGEIQAAGVIVRVRDTQYTVHLDKGLRCYVYADDLRPEKQMKVRRAIEPSTP
jgi:hypothetical protein